MHFSPPSSSTRALAPSLSSPSRACSSRSAPTPSSNAFSAACAAASFAASSLANTSGSLTALAKKSSSNFLASPLPHAPGLAGWHGGACVCRQLLEGAAAFVRLELPVRVGAHQRREPCHPKQLAQRPTAAAANAAAVLAVLDLEEGRVSCVQSTSATSTEWVLAVVTAVAAVTAAALLPSSAP
eukprot:CAMPEP_0171678424 /NCGR_PEP_ID=MMETSP0990-20121206/55661_1 /TAXON_ID=483369 /ORGANISM="non described non described, Strain CCMP2098" /LENGTH=183 /DNA_ID=CAMNT_0012265071 /DNA_START=160 /DNA_END=709 /DNA_ORIENTATION=+